MAEQVTETEVKNEYSSLEKAMGIKKEEAPIASGANTNVVIPEAKEDTSAKPEEPVAAIPAEQKEKKINIDDLTDEEINALIEKKTGGRVKSLIELDKPEPKSKEDIEKEEAKRKADALSWAIENGKFKMTDYDNSIKGQSKTDREVALAKFTAEIQAEDKDITAEEAEEMFKDAFHETDDTTKLYKIGQKEIKKMADQIRKEQYSLPDYESEYHEFTQTQDQYKSYRATIKKVSSEIPKEFEIKMPYQYLDGVKDEITYKIPVDDKLFNKLLTDASSENSFLAENFFSDKKLDEKQIAKKLNHNLKAIMFDALIPELLKQNTEEVEKRIEVVLGNKRNGAPQLNNGNQPINKVAVKPNTYSALEAAMSKNR